MNDAIMTYKAGNWVAKVYGDDDPLNPRKDYDNLGTLYYLSNRDAAGDVQLDDRMEIYHKLQDPALIALRIYFYSHSGFMLRAAEADPFRDGWDSGLYGVIAVEKAKVREEYGYERISAKRLDFIKGILKGEVEEYSHYANGEVYCVEIANIETGEEYDEPMTSIFGLEWAEKEVEETLHHLAGADAKIEEFYGDEDFDLEDEDWTDEE